MYIGMVPISNYDCSHGACQWNCSTFSLSIIYTTYMPFIGSNSVRVSFAAVVRMMLLALQLALAPFDNSVFNSFLFIIFYYLRLACCIATLQSNNKERSLSHPVLLCYGVGVAFRAHTLQIKVNQFH